MEQQEQTPSEALEEIVGDSDVGAQWSEAKSRAPLQSTSALSHAVGRYRELVAAMPGLVPEMVRGDTVEEVDASAELARQAYTTISRRITTEHETRVPTGNPARSSADLAAAALKPEAKIALGLRNK